jgi:hypothetical protein
MEGCINTDSGHSTMFHGLADHLSTQPLTTTSLPPSVGATSDPVILAFIRKTFYISGYTLLYLIATFAAAGVGQASAFIAEKWILELLFAERLKANRDHVEVSRQLWVLICSVGFLIVAVGLLFMHLVGGLPHEHDELAVQIGIALFGLIVFVTLSLMALFVGSCVWAAVRKLWDLARQEVVDEEAGLIKNCASLNYGTSRQSESFAQQDATVPALHENSRYIARQAPVPKRLDRTWIKMRALSSVRDLDVRWMGGHP